MEWARNGLRCEMIKSKGVVYSAET